MKILIISAFLFIIGLGIGNLFSQQRFTEEDSNCIMLERETEILKPTINFLEFAPKIDGILDDEIKHLPSRRFNYVRFHAEETYDVVPIHYRLAYGTEFLYINVEVEHNQIFYNDRAFQNGDGFQLLIAKTQKDNQPTDEYYVIACSAVDQENLKWTRKIIWVSNLTDIFIQISDETKMEFYFSGEKSSFELLLPWKDIPPFHPWHMEDIGFNLKFVKAFKNQPTCDYYVFPDRYLGWENKKPVYCRLKFEEPKIGSGIQQFVQLGRNHMSENDDFYVNILTLSSLSNEDTFIFKIYSNNGALKLQTSRTFDYSSGINKNILKLKEISTLPTEHYSIKWEKPEGTYNGEDQFTILSKFNPIQLKSEIDRTKHLISSGSYTTITYHIKKYDDILKSLKLYETAPKTRGGIEQLINIIIEASKGNDVIAGTTGFFRRAFQSRLDGTYQPYTVRIPDHFDNSQKYPLIVFLHGSASDETNMWGFSFINNGECIELGPFARGRSNFYSTDNAQYDIAEAIQDAIKNYPIDTTNIILTGFSMGGYGVYRTFYETSLRFKALAVFSGLPYVSNDTEKFPDDIYPNFMDMMKLKKFKDIPIFIFHGKQDKNCPFSKTEELVGMLKENGAQVSFYTEDNLGHQKMNSTTILQYHQWLEKVLK